MRRRNLLNIVLLLLVAGLVTLAIFDQPPKKKTAPPLTKLDRHKITKLRLQFPDKPDIVLRKQDNRWRLQAPVKARADHSTVAQILRLAEAETDRSIQAGRVDLSKIGLKPAKETVTFDRHPPIELGTTEALKDHRYARVGQKLWLIDEPNMQALNADYSDLVARKLLPPNGKIKSIQLPKVTLTPNKKGGWDVTPASADKGADAAQLTVDAWRRVRALWAKPAGKKPAKSKVVVHFANHGDIGFDVVARKPQLLLRRAELGVTFHVAANEVGPLLDMRHPQNATRPKLKPRSGIPLTSPKSAAPAGG